MPESDTTTTQEAPLPQEQQTLMSLARLILNPDGKDPRIDQYITSTFSYILGALYKMTTSSDREATAKEIADDLNRRFESWVAEREKKEKDAQAAAPASTEPEASKDQPKIEEVD
ncbi:uncharacterized protein CANTADRAFT_49317 [Suhomyces tanzawaensis NRRL Y-17324]|uniref:Uncharacterized protein n=1 Tax=Suhomyces tanzawaensis NRRL Y-17324 TaxID=984487 RepID=A0A1E4SK04_9ASCO|nr:uncharacterized protein CANTADRAFT_49317 [Suhomyces tanzawaensis NRRL Y-17324]ODV79845.1 hypothetical protein CANTADRAFT_49317 [Suhomyces tanzawaensis NRRL Y-17324]